MKPATRLAIKPLAALAAITCAMSAQAQFNSGSTGADGALTPTVNTEVVLPPSGILNYSTVNIPAGVTVTFRKNTLNTPAVLLVQGDATIAGVINVNGATATDSGAAGNGQLGDDGLPGSGGPGGFAGGRGAADGSANIAGTGLGPGGGGGGFGPFTSPCYGAQLVVLAAAGGSHNGVGTGGLASSSCNRGVVAGPTYGSSLLLPLIGGSGGGGGGGGSNFSGSGGGGGGGAILIAASGTLNVPGSIAANGGVGGNSAGPGGGAAGGGGAGGAIRLVATTLSGNGSINAVGANGGSQSGLSGVSPITSPGAGASGRIRLEALTFTRTAASNPTAVIDTPGPLFIPNSPSIRIATVAGTAVPANPTGNADVTLPTTTTNPVTVDFTSNNVPLGNTIRLTVTPANGDPVSAVSTAIAGTLAAGTATVSVTLPPGPSILQAQTTFTVVAALGDALRSFAGNERVERLEVTASLGGGSAGVKLVTVSGKRFDAPAPALALIDTFNLMQSAVAQAGS